jgi:hypothetical protein
MRTVLLWTIVDGKKDELIRQHLNFQKDIVEATQAIPGFIGLEKYVLDNKLVEILDLDISLQEFGQQFASNKGVRDFFRAIAPCITESLSDADARIMQRIAE